MSIVQAIISDQFALLCGDQKARYDDNTINDKCPKIFQIEKDALIGLTGSLQDNYRLFYPFLELNDASRTFQVKEHEKMSFSDIVITITTRFTELYNEHMSGVSYYNIFSVVCGWDGKQFIAFSFFLDESNPENQGINSIAFTPPNIVGFVSCGKPEHRVNMMKFHKKYGRNDIISIKQAFRDVLDAGVKFDDTINRNAMFLYLKKKNMI